MRFSAYCPTILSTCVAISHLWTVCAKAPSGPWDAFNLSPSSRVVRPVAIHSSQGSIKNAGNLFSDSGLATFTGNETSWIALDFGKEVSTVDSFVESVVIYCAILKLLPAIEMNSIDYRAIDMVFLKNRV